VQLELDLALWIKHLRVKPLVLANIVVLARADLDLVISIVSSKCVNDAVMEHS
jgi:hypothetical protein